jgi:hypothetical protein
MHAERLGAAKTDGAPRQLQSCPEVATRLECAVDLEHDHAGETVHLFLGQLMLRVRTQTRVVGWRDVGVE